jgi:hypothetical protein
MREYPKAIERRLRALSMAAHEEALRRALQPLAQDFERWRQGNLGSGELTERIHEFHHGPARNLFKQYNYGIMEMNIAVAIVDGLLDRTQVPPEALAAISDVVAMIEADRKADEEQGGDRLSASL